MANLRHPVESRRGPCRNFRLTESVSLRNGRQLLPFRSKLDYARGCPENGFRGNGLTGNRLRLASLRVLFFKKLLFHVPFR